MVNTLNFKHFRKS